MQEPSRPSFEFGPFLLDSGKRLLLRSGEPVPLAPKVLDTLLALIQHRADVISKDDLLRLVWGDTVVEATYAGHPGLVYEPRPRSLVALLDESARFAERTFLVQGEQRVTFSQFRRAALTASGVLQGHGVGEGENGEG